MINRERLELLLDNTFIHYASDCYQWALDSESELNLLNDLHRRQVNAYHRGVEYKEKATTLVNQAFKERIEEHQVGPIQAWDLERCWYLRQRAMPRDPLGVMYSWLISHVMMYIPDRHGNQLRAIENDELFDTLFKDFIDWCEKNSVLQTLIVKAGSPTYIDEARGLFGLVVQTSMDTNSYVGQLVQSNRRKQGDRRKQSLHVDQEKRQGGDRRQRAAK